MKIAIVMPVAQQLGGSEMLLRHLLHASSGSSVNQYALAFLEEGPMVEEARGLGYATEVFEAGRLRQMGRACRVVQQLSRWLQMEKVDAALSWMPKAHLYVAPAAWHARIRAIWWQHGITTGSWMDRLVTLLPAELVICCSRAAAEAQGRLVPRRTAQVVYPAADLRAFDPDRLPSPAEARSTLGLPANGKVIAAVARLQSQKGLSIFLRAAAEVARRYPNAQFVLVGGTHPLEPHHEGDLRALASELGIAGVTVFAGHQENVPMWLQASDCVVHPAVQPEGFGMSIVEAMAVGRWVIATRIGGPVEIITDGVNGSLIPPGDAEALAGAIMGRMAGAPGPAVSQAARERARDFSVPSFVRALTETLAEALGASKPSFTEGGDKGIGVQKDNPSNERG